MGLNDDMVELGYVIEDPETRIERYNPQMKKALTKNHVNLDPEVLNQKVERPPMPSTLKKVDKKGRPPVQAAPIVRYRPNSGVGGGLTESKMIKEEKPAKK